ncbi:DUF4279 domain-containing protein [Lysinibacillus cavernae]|uniref:DUF4279 domain-containing protein n=1 Tax=Lysinibacillus cavernae TaxID=2666135 RepID=UPI001E5008DE|nr:DUF4279 domain-containing protein [Lysinibacillus cavernae]
MKTTQYAYLLISGNDDFSLEVVTQRLGILPTATWKIGDSVQPNNPRNLLEHSYTGWKYESAALETLETQEVLHPLLEVFQSKIDIINQLKEELTLDVQMELVIQIYDGHTPGLVIYPAFSKFLSEINAFLDIDMYAYSYDEPYRNNTHHIKGSTSKCPFH